MATYVGCCSCPPPGGQDSCIFCYNPVYVRTLDGFERDGTCLKCHRSLKNRVFYHAHCGRRARACVLDVTQEDLLQLSLCTKPIAQRWCFQDLRIVLDSLQRLGLTGPVERDKSILFAQSAPDPVKEAIARHLEPDFEIIAMAQTPRLVKMIRSIVLGDAVIFAEIDKPVYISTITFRGREYVSSFSNRAPPIPASTHSLHVVGHILWWTDEFGVRGICGRPQDMSIPTQDRHHYLSMFDIRPGWRGRLVGETDGLMIRRLCVRFDAGTSSHDYGDQWNTLRHPPLSSSTSIFSCRSRGKGSLNQLDFHSFENNPEGITACARAGATVALFVHTPGADFSLFLTQYATLFGLENLVFIHMSLARGEQITDVSVRTLSKTAGLAARPVIILQTSKGRMGVFGHHVEPGCEAAFVQQQVSVDTPGSMLGIYTAATERNMPVFTDIGVFTQPPPPRPAVPLFSPVGRSELYCPRVGAPNRDWYLTLHPLEGVVSVRLCRDFASTDHLPLCQGMLLIYEDGRREAAGQLHPIRPLDSPVDVGVLHLRNWRDGDRPRVSFTLQPDAQGSDWISPSLGGQIAWWFGTKGSRCDILEI